MAAYQRAEDVRARRPPLHHPSGHGPLLFQAGGGGGDYPAVHLATSGKKPPAATDKRLWRFSLTASVQNGLFVCLQGPAWGTAQ